MSPSTSHCLPSTLATWKASSSFSNPSGSYFRTGKSRTRAASGTPADDEVVRAVAVGIRGRDTNHLHTAELDYLVSSPLDDTNWNGIFALNATYTYSPTYARLRQDFGRTNFLPTFMVEANYEFESLQGPVTTPLILRKQEYGTKKKVSVLTFD